MWPGEEKAWKALAESDPESVCRDAGTIYDGSKRVYVLSSFSLDIHISLDKKDIFSTESESHVLLERLGTYSRLTFLWYLVHAKDIPVSGRLVRPESLKGGHLFSRGTHVLPLDRLAARYGKDIEGFLLKGSELDAERTEYGDASVMLYPVPRIPMTIILWKGDAEFPPRADLLFDSTAEFQAPVDILWSIAMMNVLMMLQGK